MLLVMCVGGRDWIGMLIPIVIVTTTPYYTKKISRANALAINISPLKENIEFNAQKPPLKFPPKGLHQQGPAKAIPTYDLSDIPIPKKRYRGMDDQKAPPPPPAKTAGPKPTTKRESCALLKPDLAPPKGHVELTPLQIGETMSIFIDEPDNKRPVEPAEKFIEQADIFL